MLKKTGCWALLLSAFVGLALTAQASQPEGTISSFVVHGIATGSNSEAVIITIEPAVSDCPQKGQFVLFAKEKPTMVASLMAAYHSGAKVLLIGKGNCHAAWTGQEELDYVVFKKN